MAFSPNGKRIASGSNDNTIKLWDTATGNLEKTLAGYSHRAYVVAFSPDGKRIASGSDMWIKVWDNATNDIEKKTLIHISEDNTVSV